MSGRRDRLRPLDLRDADASAKTLNTLHQGLYERIEALESARPIVIIHEFATRADPPGVEAGFPMLITLPDGVVALGVVVWRLENITTPTATAYETVSAPSFEPYGRSIRVPFITGLEPSTRYRLTFEVKRA